MSIPPHMNPMTPDEVRELLGATMHGDLPRPTIQRMLATLAAWEPTVRAVKNEAVAAHDVVAILDAENQETDKGSWTHDKRVPVCPCMKRGIRSKRYNAYYCPACLTWCEPKCSDAICEFCSGRPDAPVGTD